MLKKAITYYFVACGLALHIGAAVALYFVLQHFSLTPTQFLIKGIEKLNLDAPFLVSLLEPSPRYSSHQLDGSIKAQHPRILLPNIAALSAHARVTFFQDRKVLYEGGPIKAPALPCKQTHLSALTTCWFTTGNKQKFTQALQKLLNYKVETPDVTGRYGNGLALALNYDLLASAKHITQAQHQQIQEKLEKAIVDYLRVLDGDSPSLWHGRLSLSSNAWLCAVMLDANTSRRKELVARTQGHFLDTVNSVAITESWPEGYNYWINSRAFPFVLAASAYINALKGSEHAKTITRLLERIGLWHIYATRPDNKIEGYGDEGPRIDLKDDTRRIIDIIASTTGNSQLAQYSLYLQNLHGRESYYRGYRWAFYLFNDPELLPANATGAFKELALFMPKAELFGQDGSNALYVRSDWGPDATYLTYRAGHKFTHHGHHDAGHFTLFKGRPLAVNSSRYGGFTSDNRLNYSIRTIAKNSLLIQRPGEVVKPNRFFKENVADGGQRITLPTGSAIRSTQYLKDNLYKGQHLGGAELKHFSSSSEYTYIQSDLTPGYNNTQYDENGDGGKVRVVQRALFYLNEEDILLVHDNIETTNADYRAKWLLHSLAKPRVKDEEVLKGSVDNGILRSMSNTAVLQEGTSNLKISVLLPHKPTLHLVGGDDFRFYVETDGDDSTLDGKNMIAGNKDKPWFENAKWRTEIFSTENKVKHQFLVALAPAAIGLNPITASLLNTSNKEHFGALLGTTAVLFTQRRGQFSLDLPASVKRLYLVGPLDRPRRISLRGNDLQKIQHKNNVTRVLLPNSNNTISLSVDL